MEPLEIVTVRDGDRPFTSHAQGLSLASDVFLGSQAPYDSSKGAHVRTITIEKPTNFVLRPMTITDGPMAGLEALVLMPSSSFRFLDLPTEIRYLIYDILIPTRLAKLEVSNRHVHGNKGPKVVPAGQAYGYGSKGWKRSRQWDDEAQRYIQRRGRRAMSLLLTNKQLYRETFEVLYRSQRFGFDNAVTLCRFFELNVAAAQYMTDVELAGPFRYMYDQTGIGNTFKKYAQNKSIERGLKILAKAQPTALRTLRLDHLSIRGKFDVRREGAPRSDADALLKECIVVLNAVHRARRQKGIATGLDEVLKIGHQWCRCARSNTGVRLDTTGECQSFDDQIKDLVRGAFLMEPQ